MDLLLLRGGEVAFQAPVQLQLWPQEPSLEATLHIQDAARLLLLGALPRVEAATGRPTRPSYLRLLPSS
jgi:hypothetical protein